MKMTTRCLMGCAAGLLFCAAGITTVRANTLVTFSVDMTTNYLNGTFNPAIDTVFVAGTFNNWSAPVQLQEVGLTAPYIYTNNVDDTSDAYGGQLQYKFINSHAGLPLGGWEQLATGQNRLAQLPPAGGSTNLPTPFWGDSGAPVVNAVTFQVDMSEQIYLGNFVPTNGEEISVGGIFNGWNLGAMVLTNANQYVSEPGGITTNQVYANTFLIPNSPAGIEEFKYVIYNPNTSVANYESPQPANGDPNNNHNRYFANVAQTLPLVYFSDTAFSPLTVSNLTFSVDCSVLAATDTNFNGSAVMIRGNFTGWNASINAYNAIACTNNPTAANTNLYTATSNFIAGVPSLLQYQFVDDFEKNYSINYDHAAGGGDRYVAVVNTNLTGSNIVSIWNDAARDDYLLRPTPVFFSVDMAPGGVYPTDNNGHVFNPAVDAVYINGLFNGFYLYGLYDAGWFPWETSQPVPMPPGYQMIREGTSSIFTNTVMILGSSSPDIIYKYGTDPGGFFGGPEDDEAPVGQNHVRVIRNSSLNPYIMPLDTFAQQYSEPYFTSNSTTASSLTVGPASGTTVPVMWLGRPGAHLQVKTNLVNGIWQDVWATDGTNWTAGFDSTNGFVSVTNWPTESGTAYFRLVKP